MADLNKPDLISEKQGLIRNFCIIAHIDHGKSTLADRILEMTGAVSTREMREQYLDTMDLERERGITIKLQTVRLEYTALDGRCYTLNLIDTPGHVDFTYEVSRSLAACEGALLVVDASQGIEAQTLANVYLAMEQNLELIPLINKIDLPNADTGRVAGEMETVLGLPASEVIPISAKLGSGVKEVLEALVRLVPPPEGNPEKPLQALIFDSVFDSYRGGISYIRIFEGKVKKGDIIRMMSSGKEFEVSEVGVFSPRMKQVDSLSVGEVGYLAAGVKNVRDTMVGDTITLASNPAELPLPGYRRVKPVVFSGLYPINSEEFEKLRDALDRLNLNDSSFSFEPETSVALGFGFRCGFLGLLHMDIFKERLEREFGLNLISSAPSVVYQVHLTNGEMIEVDNPAVWPDPTTIERVQEPFVKASMMLPENFIGSIMELCQDRRGIFKNIEHLSPTRVLLTYELPLSEILYDFFDNLKSRSRGYASLDYEVIGYRDSDLEKIDILLNGEPVDALSFIAHRDKAYARGKAVVEKLRHVIPRQMFDVAIQAGIGNRIIARESLKARRKDVLAKCYGGDITRKKKLLEKQKEGKKRMKIIGRVEVPKETFISILNVEEKKA
jgi:GTP-binding protein LepA